ncbi:hypothetical protein CERSUDRAFT_148305 [Gelatoporia subvermispora B]|uniref:RRM domain-containing protein n=1 Tax=Ceriporiopsis subvermispora (strain B) TaxID=914234 RepID=M2PUE3_CERS8|nr:hypothetical protein CERSUDRAFT_148305 [Gelatoporia subvermispora B]
MAQSASLPSNVAGFTPLPVAYSESATHILYARAHSGSKKSKSNSKGKDAELPEGRTLFLVNVPPDATEREITQFFKSSGTVERVIFDGDSAQPEEDLGAGSESESEDEDAQMEEAEGEDADEQEDQPRKKRRTQKNAPPQVVPLPSSSLRTLRRTGRTAHVVFLDASSLARALSAPSKPRPWPIDSATPHGLAHYTALHTALRPPLDVVRAHADSWMELFEWEQARKKQESKYRMGEAVVDEDGFTLVTRGGAYGKTLGGGVGVASKKFQGGQTGKRTRKSKEKQEKDTFYAFQVHEKKRKELVDLKQKWEEDKEKVEKLKQSRKFKPY